MLEESIRVPEKYILVYQLHQNSEMDKYIGILQEKYGMPCYEWIYTIIML